MEGYINMNKCILEDNFEGQGWSGGGDVLEVVLPGRGQMTYVGE